MRKRGTSDNAMAYGLAIGVALGTAFGFMFDNFALGVAIGIALGTEVGASVQSKKKHNGYASLKTPAAGTLNLGPRQPDVFPI